MTAVPAMAAGNPNLEGTAPMPPPPGTDMTGICFRDQLWLNTYPLDRNLVFDYFALSPFYDWTCNNEQLRSRSIHPLDSSYLSCALNLVYLKPLVSFVYLIPFLLIVYVITIRKMTGNEYVMSEVMEPHLFVIRKVKRDSPEKTMVMLTYYILDGSIYQAPQLCNVFAARIGRSIYHMSKAFNIAASKLEKIGYVDSGSKCTNSYTNVAKEAANIKELKRVDHIFSLIQRKLPTAPAPPPFPEGYAPPSPEAEKGLDLQNSEAQPPPMDPIIDQGPAKRVKFQ